MSNSASPNITNAKIETQLQADGTIHIFTAEENAKDLTDLKSINIVQLVQEVCRIQLKFSEAQREEALAIFSQLKAVLKEASSMIDEQIDLYGGELDLPPTETQRSKPH
ncbi:MAG: hypothetical protein Q7K26_01295 [bacterium]|nr:hypothetical protein [bacterium]